VEVRDSEEDEAAARSDGRPRVVRVSRRARAGQQSRARAPCASPPV